MATIDDFLTAVQLSRAKEGEDLTWRAILDDLSDEDLRKIRGAFSTGNTRSHLIHDAVRQTWGATLSRDESQFRALKENLKVPKRVPADKYSLFVPAGRAGEAANVPESLAQAIGGRSRADLIRAIKRLDRAVGISTSTAGLTKTQLVNLILTRMDQMTDTRVVSLGGPPPTSQRGVGAAVRASRRAGRRRMLPPGRGATSVTDFLEGEVADVVDEVASRQSTAMVRRGGPLASMPEPEVIDAEFTERPRRRRGRSPGPPRGEPLVTDPPTPRKMLPQKVDLSKSPVSKLAKLKGLTRFLGPVAVGLAAVDLAARVLDASQGNIDRQRLHREAIGEDLLANVGLGLEEQQAENTRRAVGGLANVQQGLDLAAAVRAPVEEYNDLEGLLLQRRAELAGVAVRAEPSRDEYMLAMRRFM